MGRLLRIAAVAATALTFAAGQAEAAVTVAGGSPGATLLAGDTDDDGLDQLELTLTGPADAGPAEDFMQVESDDPPLWPDELVLAAETLPSADGSTRILVGGAVNAAAASVEIGFGGPRVLRLGTLEGSAYQGRHAGQVRFFLGEITLPEADVDDDPVRVRMLDASGTAIGVANDSDTKRSVGLMRRRVGDAVIRMNATLTSRLAPLPQAPVHRSEELCLLVGVNGSPSDWEAACQRTREAVQLGGRRGCGRVPTTLAGFLPAGTRTLAVRLGSGRTVRLSTRATPFGRPGRIVTAVLPRGEAIRTVTAIDGAGHRLAREDVLLAPPDRRCARPLTTDELEHWSFFSDPPEPRFGTPPGTELAAVAGARRLLVRDAADDLCIGIDRLDLDGAGCGPPPVNSHQDALYVDPGAGIVAGLYAAPVTAVDLRFRGGGTARIPASEGLSYTGRYRSAVRFAFAPIPPGRTVVGAVLRDPAGREIGTALPVGPGTDDTLIGRPKTALSIGSGRGAARVVVGATRSPLSSRTFACVGLELGSERSECDDDFAFASNSVNAVVPCGTRQTVLFGIARPDVARLDIRLSSGREVQPTMARFPPGLGTRAKVFLAVLPRDVAVTRVRFARKHLAGRSDTVVLPTRAPARQCGYEFRDTLP